MITLKKNNWLVWLEQKRNLLDLDCLNLGLNNMDHLIYRNQSEERLIRIPVIGQRRILGFSLASFKVFVCV